MTALIALFDGTTFFGSDGWFVVAWLLEVNIRRRVAWWFSPKLAFDTTRVCFGAYVRCR